MVASSRYQIIKDIHIVSALVSDHDQQQSTKETFRVIFWGDVAAGYTKKEVALAFAERFNIKSRRQLAQIFSGRVIPLKSGLKISEAHRYISAIQDIGGICRLENEYRDYFGNEELKTRNSVSFLDQEDGFDAEDWQLAPKQEKPKTEKVKEKEEA